MSIRSVDDIRRDHDDFRRWQNRPNRGLVPKPMPANWRDVGLLLLYADRSEQQAETIDRLTAELGRSQAVIEAAENLAKHLPVHRERDHFLSSQAACELSLKFALARYRESETPDTPERINPEYTVERMGDKNDEAAIEEIVNDPNAPWNHDTDCPVHKGRGGECNCEPLMTKDSG